MIGHKRRMKRYCDRLVMVAKVWSHGAFPLIANKYPFAGEIDLERWDLFMTAACVWSAIEKLSKRTVALYKQIDESMAERNPEGFNAFADCDDFMRRRQAKGILTDDSLGIWIVINLYGRKELNDNENKLMRALGDMVADEFSSGAWQKLGA